MKKINENKIRYFRELFWYWAGKLNLPKNIRIHICPEDVAAVEADDKKTVLYYDPESISTLKRFEIIELVLHELGHLVCNTTYESQEEKITAEYFAEQFAIDTIKKHYPQYLKRILKSIYLSIKDIDEKENNIYRPAYLKVPEIKKYAERQEKK